uniref:Ssu-2 homolog n=1 Tax=Strigops habroptila TaxID=2489341 RepID=A0A672VFM0_STRHB
CPFPIGAEPLPPPMELMGEPREQSNTNLSPLPPSMPPMTEAAARRALLRFMSSRCCYGSRAAGDLAIQCLRQYRLETFSESRLSEWVFEPFTSKCHGHGRSKCRVCHGAGQVRSWETFCQAAFPIPLSTGCNTCSGRGSKTCVTCQGEKKLQHFKQLVVTWKNNVFEFVSEHHLNFPGELLSKVSGESIFKDENVMVYPIIDFPEPEISLASQRAIAEHNAAFATSSRILRQVRGSLWHVPLPAAHPASDGVLDPGFRHNKMLRIVTHFLSFRGDL